MKTVHHLKCDKEFFDDMLDGTKKLDIRKDDRNFEVGDLVIQHEYIDGALTGRTVSHKIRYVLRNYPHIDRGYVALGLKWPTKFEDIAQKIKTLKTVMNYIDDPSKDVRVEVAEEIRFLEDYLAIQQTGVNNAKN